MASTRKAIAVLRGKLWSREEVDLKNLRMTVGSSYLWSLLSTYFMLDLML